MPEFDSALSGIVLCPTVNSMTALGLPYGVNFVCISETTCGSQGQCYNVKKRCL